MTATTLGARMEFRGCRRTPKISCADSTRAGVEEGGTEIGVVSKVFILTGKVIYFCQFDTDTGHFSFDRHQFVSLTRLCRKRKRQLSRDWQKETLSCSMPGQVWEN
jgi:hypothetical protein